MRVAQPFPRPFQAARIDAEELKSLYAQGIGEEEIARHFGIKKQTLQARIRNSASLARAKKEGIANL